MKPNAAKIPEWKIHNAKLRKILIDRIKAQPVEPTRILTGSEVAEFLSKF